MEGRGHLKNVRKFSMGEVKFFENQQARENYDFATHGYERVMTWIKCDARIRSAKCEISRWPLDACLPRNLHSSIITCLNFQTTFEVHSDVSLESVILKLNVRKTNKLLHLILVPVIYRSRLSEQRVFDSDLT